jgi:Spy/CpxP family protein refolding chaperone
MKRFSGKLGMAIAAVAIAVIVSQIAVAQNEGRRGRGGRGGGPGGPGGPGGFLNMNMLLSVDKVQTELKLSDEQKSKLEKVNKEVSEERSKLRESGTRPDPEKMEKMREANQAKVNEVLDAGQQKRLMGIYIQVAGPRALGDPAVAKELKITDEQKTKLREALGSMRPARDGGGARGGSREEAQAKMEKARDEANKKVMEVLTADQQKKLESLKGEKVDIKLSDLFRQGGGGQRGGRGRANRGADRGADQPSEKKSST